jgi:hypothetical protein
MKGGIKVSILREPAAPCPPQGPQFRLLLVCGFLRQTVGQLFDQCHAINQAQALSHTPDLFEHGL